MNETTIVFTASSAGPRGISGNVVNVWNFLDWRERMREFEGIAAMLYPYPMNVTGKGEPFSVPGLGVSSAFFSILKVQPLMGRMFHPDDEVPGRMQVVLISHNLWMTRFGGVTRRRLAHESW